MLKAIKQTKHKQTIKSPDIKLASIKPMSEVIKLFPSTRYYGSKKRLLPWIYENVKTLDFQTVLDGFGGTASTSLLFKAMGKDVTYHDAFSFNKFVAQAVLTDSLSVSKETFIEFIKNTVPKKGFIYKNFQGLYYTDLENCWIDGFASKLFASNLSDKDISLYMYTLFQACLQKRPFNLFHRANLHLRLNKKVKREFGNFTTWERSFSELIIKSYDELEKSIWKSKGQIKILNPSSITRLRAGYDLVYLDPPYISLTEKNNRDDYWRRYHFLEGLAQYPEWKGLIDKKSNLKAIPAPKRFLDWSEKRIFKEKLCALIKKHKDSIVVLSYLSDSYPDESDIKAYFESLFSKVSVHSKDHTHALAKSRKRELLFIGRQ